MAEEKAYPGMTAEQKEAYVNALKHEEDGYKARVEQSKAAGDDDGEKTASDRIKQVQAELKRVGSVRPSKRAETRKAESESAGETE